MKFPDDPFLKDADGAAKFCKDLLTRKGWRGRSDYTSAIGWSARWAFHWAQKSKAWATMTEQDLDNWLELLCDDQGRRCENTGDRIEVIKGLLNHANEDGMSPEDRKVCVEALDKLARKLSIH